MNISTLIKTLQKIQEMHGDLPVTRRCEADDQEEVSVAELSNEYYYTEEYDLTKDAHVHLY